MWERSREKRILSPDNFGAGVRAVGFPCSLGNLCGVLREEKFPIDINNDQCSRVECLLILSLIFSGWFLQKSRGDDDKHDQHTGLSQG